MTLNEDTGCITLPEIGVAIKSTLSRSEFLQTAAFAGASVSFRNEPWCSYRLPSIPQPDTELLIVLQFHAEHLLSLSLSHAASRFGSSWADWSEERQLVLKAFHERWLARDVSVHLGEYSWGAISSDYDGKGGSSVITVRYANRNA